MTRAERRRFQRALGQPFPKMKRKRPAVPGLAQAVQQAVAERVERRELITGRVAPQKLILP